MSHSCILLPAINTPLSAAKPPTLVIVGVAMLPYVSGFSLVNKALSAKKENTGEAHEKK